MLWQQTGNVEKLAIQIDESGYKPTILIGIMRGGAPMIDVLSKDEYVKQSIKGLDEIGKQRALIKYAKLFKLKPPRNDEENWLLSFVWVDPWRGSNLLNDAIKQIKKELLVDS